MTDYDIRQALLRVYRAAKPASEDVAWHAAVESLPLEVVEEIARTRKYNGWIMDAARDITENRWWT